MGWIPTPLPPRPTPRPYQFGHGHVTPNPDGSKARCGGPAFCTACAAELGRKQARDKRPITMAKLVLLQVVPPLVGLIVGFIIGRAN
jgi:hypothetical protein